MKYPKSKLVVICAALVAVWVSAVQAGDVTLKTDHPQYPGEGAFQTVEQCAAFATKGAENSQEKALAMYEWFLTHQWHLMSPMEWCVPGRNPDTANPGDYETVVFDANRGRFSYGYGLCGTTHAWNEVYWKALGFKARRREFPNHINSEVFYDNQWHAFDSDMAGLVFRKDGVVAGYNDIQKDISLVDAKHPSLPHYPFAWPSDFTTMKKGWQEVAQRDSWYKLYNGGYECHPAIVQLRKGEAWTRWYDRDHFGGPSRRRYWQNQEGGPHRMWNYFNSGTPFHSDGKSNSRNEATYCNGVFEYVPNLTKPETANDLRHRTTNAGFRNESPRLFSADGLECSATFCHFSPYVICGDPLDDANPMSAAASDGLVLSGTASGIVRCEVSVNEGQSWHHVSLSPPTNKTASNSTSFQADLTELVKGRYGWLIRFTWARSAGIDSLKFVTTTQVAQAMYPRLTSNGCSVDYQHKPRGVVAMLPNFGAAETYVHKFEQTSFRSSNLKYTARSPKNRFAYQATDDRPASVVFKLKVPDQLQMIHAAFRYQVPVPPTAGCEFKMEYSIDAGESWTQFAKAEIVADNEFSSGWLYGKADVTGTSAKEALIKAHLHTPGRRAALIDAQFYGVHKVSLPGPVAVEFGWFEDGQPHTHRTSVGTGTNHTTLSIPTGKGPIQDQFVRIQAITSDRDLP